MNILDLTQAENNTEVELIQEKGNKANVKQFQHFWRMHCMVPPTTTIPPSQRKKVTMFENTFDKQIANQRLVPKGLLQNKQMGRTNKKNWREDIAYIRNLFALLKIRNNLICLDSKLEEWKHSGLYQRIMFIWEKMIPQYQASYIRLPGIFKELDELCVKENSAINLVLKYMEGTHIDKEMKSLMAINHNFYRLVFWNACNIIYFNISECYILNSFLSNFHSWKDTKDAERRNFSLHHLLPPPRDTPILFG